MSEGLNGEAVTRVAELARNAAGVEVVMISPNEAGLPSSVPVIFDKRHNGGGLRSVRDLLEQWRVNPIRRKGTAKVTTLESFIALTNRHKDANSVIFAEANWPNPSLTAVLNYHSTDPNAPRFGDHRVHYAFPVTDEFKAWADGDSKPMVQETFTAFIEEHAPELADPTSTESAQFGQLFRTKIATPAEMITLSRGLQINVASQVKSSVTLQSGEGEIVFVEEHLTDKGEKLTIPGMFMIALPAFIGGEPVRIPARLRYRVSGGKIVWIYQLFRWQEFLRQRVVADLKKSQEQTSLPTFEGSSET